MKTYRLKPVKAAQLTEENRAELLEQVKRKGLEKVEVGDWVVQWPNGEWFCVKKDVFLETFVEEKP